VKKPEVKYFISYATSPSAGGKSSINCGVISEHPFRWLRERQKEARTHWYTVYDLIWWKEITAKEYRMFPGTKG